MRTKRKAPAMATPESMAAVEFEPLDMAQIGHIPSRKEWRKQRARTIRSSDLLSRRSAKQKRSWSRQFGPPRMSLSGSYKSCRR
jgi:hypothetical protein